MLDNNVISCIVSYLEYDSEEFNKVLQYIDIKYRDKLKTNIKNKQLVRRIVTAGDMYSMRFDADTNLTLLNNQVHSFDDEPAVRYKDGVVCWCKHDKLHRDGDKPAVVYKSGSQEWWINGKLHRDNDLPAVVYVPNGMYEWWDQNGKLHRDSDKPAVIRCTGWITTYEYYLNGRFIKKI